MDNEMKAINNYSLGELLAIRIYTFEYSIAIKNKYYFILEQYHTILNGLLCVHYLIMPTAIYIGTNNNNNNNNNYVLCTSIYYLSISYKTLSLLKDQCVTILEVESAMYICVCVAER